VAEGHERVGVRAGRGEGPLLSKFLILKSLVFGAF